MKNQFRFYFFLIITLLTVLSKVSAEPSQQQINRTLEAGEVTPEEPRYWRFNLSAYNLYGAYSAAEIQSSIHEDSISVSATDPLEYFLRLTLKNTSVELKQDLPTVKQSMLISRIQHYATLINRSGHLATKLDLFVGTSAGDFANNTVDLRIYSPGIAWIRSDKRVTVETDYTYSDFKNGDIIEQLRTLVGVAYPTDRSWIQLQWFKIKPQLAFDIAGVRDTGSAELGWSFRLSEDNQRSSPVFFSSVLLGERVFAVDSTTESVFNFPDVQIASYTLGIQFKKYYAFNFSISYSYDRYAARYRDDEYQRQTLLLSLNGAW